jgi:hypothetical protein
VARAEADHVRDPLPRFLEVQIPNGLAKPLCVSVGLKSLVCFLRMQRRDSAGVKDLCFAIDSQRRESVDSTRVTAVIFGSADSKGVTAEIRQKMGRTY